MSGYEEQELTAIDAALDANPDATSNEVFQATRPYDERAIASVAASRALAGGGGSIAANDGTTSVANVMELQFAAGLVSDLGGGVAGVGLDPPFETVLLTGTGIAAGGDYLTLAHAAGESLLDYTDPQFPTFVTSGVYALTASVGAVDGSQPGKTWIVAHFTGDGATTATQSLSGFLIAPGANTPAISTEHVRNLPAESGITYFYVDHDNDTPLSFAGAMLIQRIG